VSVVIPAYNASKWIAQAIGSVLAQTSPPLEIIVIDDGSRDETVSIVNRFGTAVRLERKSNGGPGSARNRGVRLARGEWIAFLDADDWWAPTKLEKQLSVADMEQVALICTLTNVSRAGWTHEVTFDQLWRFNWIVTSSVLIRKSVFDGCGGHLEELIVSEDYNLWLRVAAAGWRIRCYPEVLTHYRRGVGLFSDPEHVLQGNLANLEQIGASCRLSPTMMLEKRMRIYSTVTKAALAKGKGGLARTISWRAFKERPSFANAIKLATAHLGPMLLNVRRRASRLDGKSNRKDMGELPEQSIRGARPVERIDFASFAPYLLLVADLEAESGTPVSPNSSIGSDAAHALCRIQRICERYDIVPTYAVDQAFASLSGGAPLLEALDDGKCEVGALFRPSPSDSFQREGAAPAIEFEKLRLLTSTIEENFGCRPLTFRSRGYGLTPGTASALDRLGFQVDCSAVPYYDLRGESGLDFRDSTNFPYWFGPGNRLLEIPVTVAMTGLLARSATVFAPLFDGSSRALSARRALASMALLERIRLDPETASIAQASRLTRDLLRRGGRVILLSCRIRPQTGNDQDALLRWVESYLEFFFREIRGLPATPSIILTEAAFASHRT
jgi:glycosyltransferase involved in cell wall biosynthesis